MSREGVLVPSLITSRRAAARAAGVRTGTITSWIDAGWLPQPPFTDADLRAAAGRPDPRFVRRGATAPDRHGTPSRWRAGCDCTACMDAHLQDVQDRRDAARYAFWETAGPPLLAALTAGLPYRQALDVAGVTAQAVTAHRRRDHDFAAVLDAALLEGRDSALAHGTPIAWRTGCRCPDCREYHEATRT